MSSQSDHTILTFTIKDDEREVDAARRVLKAWNNLLTSSAAEPVAVLQADAAFGHDSQRAVIANPHRSS